MPFTYSIREVDVTFNAWWTEYGRTPQNIQRAFDRTRAQVGGMMPPGYVPPPLREPQRSGEPAPVAGLVPRSLSQSLDVEAMSELELRAEAEALRSYLSTPGGSRDNASLGALLARIKARINALKPPTPLQKAASKAFSQGAQSVAVTPITLTGNQSLDLGAMSAEELHAEAARIRFHLGAHPVNNESTRMLFQQLHNIEAELLQRDLTKPLRQLQEEAKNLAEQSASSTGTTVDEIGKSHLRQVQDLILARSYLPEPGAFSLAPGVIEEAIESGNESRLVEPLSLADPNPSIENWDLRSLQVEAARIRFWLAFHPEESQRALEMTDLLQRIEVAIIEVIVLEVGEAQKTQEYIERVEAEARHQALIGALRVRPGDYALGMKLWFDVNQGIEDIKQIDPKILLTAADVVLGFVPVVGEVLSAVEAVIGYDLAGRELAVWERGLLAAAAIPIVGKAAKMAKVGARLMTLGAHAATGIARLNHAISAAVTIGRAGVRGVAEIALACARWGRRAAEVVPLLSRLASLSMHQGVLAEAMQLLRALSPLTNAAKRAVIAIAKVFRRGATFADDARSLDQIIGDGRKVSGWTGFKNAARLSRSELLAVRNELNRIGVDLVRHADKILDRYRKLSRSGEGPAAAFLWGGDLARPRVLLRNGATWYQAFHEMTHARQYAAIGVKAYEELGRFEREAHVFRVIWKNRRKFNRAEIEHALWYIRELQRANGGKIGLPFEYGQRIKKGLIP